MKVKITFVLADDSEDTIILTGKSVKELQKMAADEYKHRGAKDAWSESITEK